VQILEEARALLLPEADEMIQASVEEAQMNMTTLLEEQLRDSSD